MNRTFLKCAAVTAALTVSGGAYAAHWAGHRGVGAVHMGGFQPMHMNIPRTFAAPAFTPSHSAMNLAPRAVGGATVMTPARSSDHTINPPATGTADPASAVPSIEAGVGGGGFAPTVPVTVPNVNTCPGFLAPNCNPMQCVCSIAGQ
jgi:hypothetical protein